MVLRKYCEIWLLKQQGTSTRGVQNLGSDALYPQNIDISWCSWTPLFGCGKPDFFFKWLPLNCCFILPPPFKGGEAKWSAGMVSCHLNWTVRWVFPSSVKFKWWAGIKPFSFALSVQRGKARKSTSIASCHFNWRAWQLSNGRQPLNLFRSPLLMELLDFNAGFFRLSYISSQNP